MHHGVGKEDAIVGGIVIAVTYALHHSHNLEANAIQQDRAADGGSAAGKQVLHHLVPDHAHEALLGIVGIVEPAPTVERQVADGIEVRRNSDDLAVGVAVVADFANVLPS